VTKSPTKKHRKKYAISLEKLKQHLKNKMESPHSSRCPKTKDNGSNPTRKLENTRKTTNNNTVRRKKNPSLLVTKTKGRMKQTYSIRKMQYIKSINKPKKPRSKVTKHAL